MNENKKDTEEIREFIGLMKLLDETQQTGFLLILQGLRIMAEKKQRIARRSRLKY